MDCKDVEFEIEREGKKNGRIALAILPLYI
jgi:hypothetical protein